MRLCVGCVGETRQPRLLLSPAYRPSFPHTSLTHGKHNTRQPRQPPTPTQPPNLKGFAIANLVKFCVLIPFVHRWVLGRGIALTALAFYAAYSAAYCLLVSGAI